jgi:hypothetical protein
MRIAVTGASGMLGSALVPALQQAGHQVLRIGRGASADVQWSPADGTLDAGKLAGVDAFIHLAGATIGERWTATHRREILDSRVQGTLLLARTIASLSPRPRVLICASAVGIYGDAGNAILAETAPTGTDYLSDVGRAWEASADAARDAGIRTVHLRLGVLLSRRGGALARLLPVFKLGAGGRVGSGTQWMSWLSMDDAIGIVQFALAHPSLAGAVNAVAPEPVMNAQFTAALAHVLHRPAIFPVPAAALTLVFGEMARATLLSSQRAVPLRLLEAGYVFRHPTIEPALRAAVIA